MLITQCHGNLNVAGAPTNPTAEILSFNSLII